MSFDLQEVSSKGNIIGHTDTGLPVYRNYDHKEHNKFNKEECKQARCLHEKLLQKIQDKLKENKISNPPKKLQEFIEFHEMQKKLWTENVKKSIVALDSGMPATNIETGQFSNDQIANKDHPLLKEITETMKSYKLGDLPVIFPLGVAKELSLHKVEEGLYSGVVKGTHTVEGSHENLLKFDSLPLPTIFSTLLAKEFITMPEATIVEDKVEERSLEEKLLEKLEQLKESYKIINIHL